MEKIIAEDLYKTSPDKFKIFRDWGDVNRKVIDFENKSNLKTFQFIFGEEEGLRLCGHFKNDCDSNLMKLRTYLVNDQFNDLLVNIYYNENLFII